MATNPSTAAQIAALQKDAAILAERLQNQEGVLQRHEQSPDQHELTSLREFRARAEVQLEELLKARDLTGNRLFQIGVAILAAQFTLIATLLALVLRK